MSFSLTIPSVIVFPYRHLLRRDGLLFPLNTSAVFRSRPRSLLQPMIVQTYNPWILLNPNPNQTLKFENLVKTPHFAFVLMLLLGFQLSYAANYWNTKEWNKRNDGDVGLTGREELLRSSG